MTQPAETSAGRALSFTRLPGMIGLPPATAPNRGMRVLAGKLFSCVTGDEARKGHSSSWFQLSHGRRSLE